MQYKRLEMYLGWTCNNKCLFCVEMRTMDKMWNRKITEKEVLKKLIKYKKQGYNHVTYLGGEPFIQQNFGFALKVGKKLGYTIMVTTNGNMIQYDHVAKKFLPYIDQLIISIPIIDKKLQPIINNTKALIDFDDVFRNIKKYWNGNFLKVNTVINPLNIDFVYDIVRFIKKYDVKELSFTYPDIDTRKYSKEHIKKYIIIPYGEAVTKITKAFELALQSGIRTKITDIPFCFFPDRSWIPYTDDYDYEGRMKIMYDESEFQRKGAPERKENTDQILDEYQDNVRREMGTPRMRKYIKECKKCQYIGVCWGVAECYEYFYEDTKVVPMKSDKK